ncbi:MAG: type IV toxin-antitoxin system AbiEi family antitoxin [Victivallales bacterium]
MKIEKDILKQGLEVLESILDEHGLVHKKVSAHGVGKRKWDARLALPEIRRDILIEAKAVFQPGQIGEFAYSFGFEEATQDKKGDLLPLIITRRITENAFDCCKKNNIAVIDLNKNVLLKLPGLVIERYREPKEGNKHLGTSGTVFSAKASRIVRALLSRPQMPWEQAKLVDKTGITQGYASQILAKMQSEKYIFQIGGFIKLIDPDRLLNDWVAHYRFDRHKKNEFALNFNSYDEGLRKLSDELKRIGIKSALTGWSGAFILAPYGVPPKIMAYVQKVPATKDSPVLFPVERDGNVVLYLPHDEGVFQFNSNTTGNEYCPVVSEAQLYLDLSKMPGRAKEQAEHFKEECLKWGNN